MSSKKLHDFFDSDMLQLLDFEPRLCRKMAGRALELKDIELAWCPGADCSNLILSIT
jgi:hypothetical protein